MSTRMNIAVRGLFATPVAALEVPDAEARNVELSAIILKKRETTLSVQASNAGGWHSDREIASWGGPQVAFILDLAKEMANRLTADRNGQSVKPKWGVMAWANVNGPGDGNICHYHPGAFWSGTYYVADGGCATDHSLGGEFEMLDPRGAWTRNVRAQFEIHGRRRPVGRRGGNHQAASQASCSCFPRGSFIRFVPTGATICASPSRSISAFKLPRGSVACQFRLRERARGNLRSSPSCASRDGWRSRISPHISASPCKP